MFETVLIFVPMIVLFALNVATLNMHERVEVKIDNKNKGE